MSSLRFGLMWNGEGSPVDIARRGEDAGYATLLFPDHTGMMAPIPAMAAAAAVTSTIRLGTQVINPAFRPLGALAQELAAVDIVSAGRLEVGIGAGYAEQEVTSLGLPFPRVADRVRDVARTLDVLPRLFAGERVTEDPGPGRLHDFVLDPTPPQGAAVPMMVGGNGDNLLAAGARRATIVQFAGFTPRPGGNDFTHFGDNGLAGRVAHVRQVAGARFPAIELSILVQLAGVAVDPAQTAGRLPLDSPFVQVGTSLDEVCDGITALRDRHGITYVCVFDGRSTGFDDVVGRLAGT